MDKITEGIIDKLSIIGFFNVVISGGVLVYGISSIMKQYVPDAFFESFGLDNEIEKALILCVMCYITGCALQSIQEAAFKHLKAGIVNNALASPDRTVDTGDIVKFKSVLGNKRQREGIINLAKKHFSEKGLGELDPDNKEMCSRFVDYCDYSNSINGYGSKASKLNESATFFEQMAVTFYVLVAVGIVILVFVHTGMWLYCLGYLVLAGIFTGRAYKYRQDWAKNVLLTFEVAADKEASEHFQRTIRLYGYKELGES